MQAFKLLLSVVLLVGVLAGCAPAASPAIPPVTPSSEPPSLAPGATSEPTQTLTTAPAVPSPTSNPTAGPTSRPTAASSPTAAPLGPETYPANVNPLTGLPVSDPASLALPPAVISISNFPLTARPQSGLSVTPLVYEVYVGYGMTRFLATVYGDSTASNGKPAVFGPIRSGRLPYEPLRMLLNGFLLIASGDETVLGELKMFTNVWNPASSDVNGVSVDSQVIKNIAGQYSAALGKPVLNGLLFNAQPPQGGKPGTQLWIPYAGMNQVIWQYGAAQGGYLRYQDNYDGLTYTQCSDAQTGQPLVYENVVVLFAPHRAIQDEKIEIGLSFVKAAPALLFRDGKMVEISWSTQDTDYYQKTGKLRMMRFVDAQGSPVALKPGKTWVEVVSSGSPYFETPASMKYEDLWNKKTPGSGAWGVQFLQPVVTK